MAETEQAEAARSLAENKREEAAVRLSNLSAEVIMLSSDAAATATVTDTINGKLISLGIPAGPKGDTGPQGEKGDTGPRGEKGDTGEKGPQGIPGNDGAKGVTFIPAVENDGKLSWSNDGGLDNPSPVNIKGPKGDTGDTGPRGERGETGEQGPQGEKGDTGAGFAVLGYFTSADMLRSSVAFPVPGDAYGVGTAQPYDIYIWDGINSSWVNNGPLQGAKGDIGPQGPQGEKGDTGEQGIQGVPGNNGITFTPSVAADGTLSWSNDGGLDNPAAVKITGPKGDTGPQGPQGEKGDTGEQGIQGVPGSNGITFTPSVAADGTLSWSNDGGLDNPAAVNITGPKGDTGSQGPQGEKGDAGEQGIQGVPGSNGIIFTPSVAADGTLSWSNDGGLENPPSVNIMGPSGLAWTRESYVEPYYFEALDGHEYYLSEITELCVGVPETLPYEFWMEIKWKVGDDYEPFFMFMSEVSFIGDEPEWLSGFTYEISVKNGIAVAGRVG